ncbi:perlucin-like protein isoform X3 [Pomacea canaliculata]|uniref:perlucin-like protein isoform X3 n=1 Tax=Pomacea canaliculata TaxID=400727 RepID=UPI000D730577|nr:perlucin-like protein isoform X3 [Pomacea canaliculata]
MMLTAVIAVVVAWSCRSLAATQCPHGWIAYQSSCYGFGSDNVTWAEAQMFCMLFGSNLAEIETPEENEFLKSIARNRNYASLWVGGTDEFSEGFWTWSGSQEPIEFRDWHVGEPSSSHGGENCLVLLRIENYQWNDELCKVATKFVCELSADEEIIG